MKKETVEKILSETKHGYDMISRKFSQTRKHFWRNLEFIGEYVKKGDRVLDFGCGNGRLLELLDVENIEYHGVDISQKLIEHAQEQYGNPSIEFKKIAVQGSLPFIDEYFNTAFSIAVFHHFPSGDFRLQKAKEIYRVTKPGGKIVVTVWNLWPAFTSFRRGRQKKYYKEIFKNWRDKILGKSDLDWNDCYISFTDNEGKKFHRFHHAFTKRELRNLFKSAGFEIESCRIIDGRNIILVAKK